MHPFPTQDIDGSGERRRHRGHENREAPVLQFFNNERGNEGFLNLGQRRLPGVSLILSPPFVESDSERANARRKERRC
jgi:hypothetical protein